MAKGWGNMTRFTKPKRLVNSVESSYKLSYFLKRNCHSFPISKMFEGSTAFVDTYYWLLFYGKLKNDTLEIAFNFNGLTVWNENWFSRQNTRRLLLMGYQSYLLKLIADIVGNAWHVGSSPPEAFLRKWVLKICSKFTEHPYRSVISIKLLCNFLDATFSKSHFGMGDSCLL